MEVPTSLALRPSPLPKGEDTPLDRLLSLVPAIAARAAALDEDGALPERDLAALAAAEGLLRTPRTVAEGGHGWGTAPDGAAPLSAALRLMGRASLSLGRFLEGHVNAVRLVLRRGTPAQARRAAADLHDGAGDARPRDRRPAGAEDALRRPGALAL